MNHLRAEPGDGGDARAADTCMDEDGACRADELRALGDRSAMISIGGASDRHGLRNCSDLGCLQFTNLDRPTQSA